MYGSVGIRLKEGNLVKLEMCSRTRADVDSHVYSCWLVRRNVNNFQMNLNSTTSVRRSGRGISRITHEYRLALVTLFTYVGFCP